MAEQKTIPTTTITTSNDTEVTIYTFYNRDKYDCNGNIGYTDLPLIEDANIMDSFGYRNGVFFKEGHLIVVSEETPTLVDYWIDNYGHLIIKGDDANSYYIDANGHLKYDICETICPSSNYVECGYVDEDYV